MKTPEEKSTEFDSKDLQYKANIEILTKLDQITESIQVVP